MERASPEKHEFYQGQVFAMSGASLSHNRITDNTLRSLGNQLEGRPCEAIGSNLRVLVEMHDLYTYPDVLVICGEPDLVPDAYLDTVRNPTLLVEVLSPSTRRYDRGDKFEFYRAIPTLQQYLLLDSVRIHAELLTRDNPRPGHWLFQETEDPDAVLDLSSIGCRLALRDAYGRVTFS